MKTCLALTVSVSLAFGSMSVTNAATITGVMAPDLLRPSDGILYPFDITVTGTYGAGEGGGVAISVSYWDRDAAIGVIPHFTDDPIHRAGPVLALPGGAAGGGWGPIAVTLEVGCTTDSEVFGPAGFTGENPMDDGFFHLIGQTNPVWGWNKVTCDARRASQTRPKGMQRRGFFSSFGDFNEDGGLDQQDIDMLTIHVMEQSQDLRFDLNGDGNVDELDRDAWVYDAKGTWFGDANLDGEFNTNDLINVFQAGKYESNEFAQWAEGDWNGDGEFSSLDVIRSFQDGGYQLGPRANVAAVPEPGRMVLLFAVGAVFGVCRSRYR